MRKIVRDLGYSLAVLGVVIAAVWVYSYVDTERQYNKVYTFAVSPQLVPHDSESIARGQHFYNVYSCRQCHGADLGGTMLIDNALLGTIGTRNLTNGKGGLQEYSGQDWIRALKHGVNVTGKPLIAMPAHETALIPNQDLLDILAFCRHQKPVDRLLPLTPGPLFRILMAFGQIGPLPVAIIDHHRKPIKRVKEAASADFGANLAITCFGCHKSDFKGGASQIPTLRSAPDISPTGRVGHWTAGEFSRTLRTGVTPEGRRLNNKYMPWKRFKDFKEIEIQALRAYLLSLPGRADRNVKILDQTRHE
ncbi:c-type cytochrome [Dyadobacter fermentans]|uniref:c-type cytochrome n=1 Tax=Dyadobacter fermentans TaxID=94254 RepID=UPI001CC0500E|nr:c-type cytochrome [Dyadobacter fermentans]MBZ1357193.1 cytochrome c [Dyadobacter fermentans]